MLEQLSAIEEEWAQLTPLVGYERDGEQLAARFAQAAKACRQRLARGTALQEARAALDDSRRRGGIPCRPRKRKALPTVGGRCRAKPEGWRPR